MKTLIAFFFLACSAFAQDLARHFELEIKQVVPGKGALANGIVYTIAPGTKIPPGQVTSNGITMPRIKEYSRPVGQLIFVRGLAEVADHDDWDGMLEPDGTFSYSTVAGAVKTVHAFKISTAPDPVAAWWKTQASQKKPFPPTMLDKK